MNEPEKVNPPQGPGRSPNTDPTNHHRQGDFGWPGPNERAAERAQDEPGMTEQDRDERDPGKASGGVYPRRRGKPGGSPHAQNASFSLPSRSTVSAIRASSSASPFARYVTEKRRNGPASSHGTQQTD